MQALKRLTLFGAVLTVLFGTAYLGGVSLAPVSLLGGGPATAASAAADPLPEGLSSSANGFTMTAGESGFRVGESRPFTFVIRRPGGEPVTAFDIMHDRLMHLIVMRRDTWGYQHLHPVMAPDGTWSVPLTLDRAGSYRLFVDFAPSGGEATTLGVDLSVPGMFEPVGHHEAATGRHPDGYTVELTGDLVAGRPSPVTMTVLHNGLPVTDLQPYLGAFGHLVAVRGNDLAFLHVHPEGAPGDGATWPGPQLSFVATVPGDGVYRLFLDFQHQGVVRTVDMTVRSVAAPAAGAPATVTHKHDHVH